MMDVDILFEEVIPQENIQSTMVWAGQNGAEPVWDRLLKQAPDCGQCHAGSGVEQDVWDGYLEAVDIFGKALKLGRLRGVVGIFAHDNHTVADSIYVRLVRELLQRDILVVVSGCVVETMGQVGLTGPGAVELAGDGLAEFCDNLEIRPVLEMGNWDNLARFQDFCSLLARNVGTNGNDLPVAALVQEDGQETREAVGLYDVAGSVVLLIDANPGKIADLAEEYIHEKRLAMAWCDRYHCRIFS